MRRISLHLGVLVSASLLASFFFGAVSARHPSLADAHPLGNFTVNRYARIELYSDAVRVRYVLDMAEIPAFQEIEAERTSSGLLSKSPGYWVSSRLRSIVETEESPTTTPTAG